MFVLDTNLLSKFRCKYKLGLSLSFASKRNNIKTCEKRPSKRMWTAAQRSALHPVVRGSVCVGWTEM